MSEQKIREQVQQILQEMGAGTLPREPMKPEERPTTPGKGNMTEDSEKMLSEDVYLFEERKRQLNNALLEKFGIKKKGS